MSAVDAFMFGLLGVLVFVLALAARYAVASQHVWHAEHHIRRPL